MKKLLLSLVAVASIATANAQQGSILVYGNVGINSTKNTDKSNDLQWNINPGVGYQFTQHITAGLEGGYWSNGHKDDGGKWASTKDFSIGAFGRYTQNLGQIFSVYGQLGAGYQNEHQSADGKKVDQSDINGFYARFVPAVGVNVYHGFALNFSFGGIDFSSMKSTVSGSNARTDFGLTFGQQVNIGISKNFGGAHHKMHGHHEPMEETRHMKTSDDDDDKAPKQKKAKSDDDE
ncbi:porin family protein [Chitinophagaceae bacterium MMS25-I14]